jgi:spermidine synthase
LAVAFRPKSQVVNRLNRGDLAQSTQAPAAAASAQVPSAGAGSSELIFDWLNANSGYGFTASRRLQTIESPYQRVEVYDTPQFGKLFRLDGRLMTSEKEEFFYHECMTHPALLTHPNPKSVLVIGGGDGGSSEEIFKHPSVRRIVMAELDAAVIDVARNHLGEIHRGALDDPRLEISIGDGFEYVKNATEKFDLIVLDLTDPDTPAFHLYSEAFFRLCRERLNPGGVLTLHLGTPVYAPETVRKNAANLRKVFKQVHPLALFIPLYGSLWCLGIASDSANPRLMTAEAIAARLRERRIAGLKYYNPEVHGGLFALPTFVRALTDPPQEPARLAA